MQFYVFPYISTYLLIFSYNLCIFLYNSTYSAKILCVHLPCVVLCTVFPQAVLQGYYYPYSSYLILQVVLHCGIIQGCTTISYICLQFYVFPYISTYLLIFSYNLCIFLYNSTYSAKILCVHLPCVVLCTVFPQAVLQGYYYPYSSYLILQVVLHCGIIQGCTTIFIYASIYLPFDKHYLIFCHTQQSNAYALLMYSLVTSPFSRNF